MSGLGPGSGSGSGLGLGLGLGLDFVAPCGKRRQPVESELPTYGDALGKVGRRGMWDRRRGCECRPQDAPLNRSFFEDDMQQSTSSETAKARACLSVVGE